MIRDCRCPQARHQHGTEQAYISDRCRCDDCRRAHTERMSWRRRMNAYGRDITRLVPSIGSARRLEALHWLGWSCERLAPMIGVDPVVLHRVRRQDRISSDKAAKIATVYDRLWTVEPPTSTKGERISVNRTKNEARRRGYLPPLAYDDDTIDDPDATPAQPPADDQPDEVLILRYMNGTTKAAPFDKSPELNEAIRRLAAAHLTDSEIGRRVGLSVHAIAKRRERSGIKPGVPSGRDVAA